MRTMLSVETEYVWRTTAGSDGVLGVDGVEDGNDDVRAWVRLLRRLTVMGVRRRVGVLKRPDSACIGVVCRGVAGLLAVLSVDIPERLGNDAKIALKGLRERLRRVGPRIVLNARRGRAADSRSLPTRQPPPPDCLR